MQPNRVYCIMLNQNVAALGAGASIFNLNNYNRVSLLKSVAFTVMLSATAAPVTFIPLEQNTFMQFALQITALPAAANFAQRFEDFAGTAAVVANGSPHIFYIPGQYKFESFFLQNSLQFAWNTLNRDALRAITINMTLIVEIQDIEKL
jgi:hypothetical protein